MSDKENISQDSSEESKYTIAIRSYRLVDNPLGDPYVHNELAFINRENPEKVEYFSFNGDPFSREDKNFTDFSRTGEDALITTLRSTEDGVPEFYGKERQGYGLVAHTVLWEGDDKNFMLMQFVKAGEAAAYLNGMDLDYYGASLLTESQNSNSINATLVSVLGYEYPEDLNDVVNAPGADRIIPLDKLPFSEFLNRFQEHERPPMVQVKGFSDYYTQVFHEIASPEGVQGRMDENKKLRETDVWEVVSEPCSRSPKAPIGVKCKAAPSAAEYFGLSGEKEFSFLNGYDPQEIINKVFADYISTSEPAIEPSVPEVVKPVVQGSVNPGM